MTPLSRFESTEGDFALSFLATISLSVPKPPMPREPQPRRLRASRRPPYASTTTQPAEPVSRPQTRPRTLRISGIPLCATKEEFGAYLKELLGYDGFIFSLVRSKHYAVATVTPTTEEPDPAALLGCAPCKKVYKCYRETGVELVVDCDFLGITPLYSADEPTVE